MPLFAHLSFNPCSNGMKKELDQYTKNEDWVQGG